MEKEFTFEEYGFSKRLKSMLKVDFRRAFTSGFFYLMIGIAFVIPILILVMTSMMDGTTTVDPQTGVETTIEGFDFVWQAIAARSDAPMSMDLTGMCNINMIYFLAAVLVCLFVCDDFRSGYAKNLFTVRAKKNEYVVSKTLFALVGGGLMIIAYIVGAMLGGKIAGVSFSLGSTKAIEVVCCMLCKVLLVGVFVPVFLMMSVVAKQRSWLAIVGSVGVGMLFFTIAPIASPLDASVLHVLLCLVGGAGFCFGFGAISNVILNKTNIL